VVAKLVQAGQSIKNLEYFCRTNLSVTMKVAMRALSSARRTLARRHQRVEKVEKGEEAAQLNRQ
jgi:hypothetical protein